MCGGDECEVGDEGEGCLKERYERKGEIWKSVAEKHILEEVSEMEKRIYKPRNTYKATRFEDY